MATVVTHESQDVDDQAKGLDGWEQSYEQLGCGRFHGSTWQLLMHDGVLLRETSNRQHRQLVVPPHNHLVLALPLAVQEGSVFAGHPLGRETLMLLDSRAEHDVVSAGEIDLIGVSVDRRLLESQLAPSKMEWLERKAAERNVELPPETAAAIRHMLLAVRASADSGLEVPGRHRAGAESAVVDRDPCRDAGDGGRAQRSAPQPSRAAPRRG